MAGSHERLVLPIYNSNYFVVKNSFRACPTRRPHALGAAVVCSKPRPGRYGAGRSKGSETGGARLGLGALVEPRDNAVNIDGGGDRDVLHVGLCHAPKPAPAQAKGADPLREGPFDAGPPLIELLALLAGRPRLRRLERLVLLLRRQPQPSAPVLGTGTAGPDGTRPTRALGFPGESEK